ncbi:MAG: putative lipid II flippase FtsW [Pseudomonadota bacterium]
MSIAERHNQPQSQATQSFDWLLFGLTVLLLCVGLTMVLSSSAFVAEFANRGQLGDRYQYFTRQTFFAGVGFMGMFALAFMPRTVLYRLQYPTFWLVVLLLVLTLTPLGTQVNGASRWIGVASLKIQPLEFAKITLVLYLAYFLSTKQELIKTISRGVVPPYFMTGLLCLLLLGQPDLGGAVVLALLLFFMCLVGGVRFIYLFISGLFASAAFGALIYISAYRRERILAFMDPFKDPDGVGYQLVQSLYAFGSGGLTGAGLGVGKQKLFYLPEAHNDFIMAVLGEEMGLIGVTVVMLLQALFFWRCFVIVLRQEDLRDRLSSFGITLILLLGTGLNLAMSIGALPPKGVAMPFLSYGGSSLVASLLCVGLLLHFSRSPR